MSGPGVRRFARIDENVPVRFRVLQAAEAERIGSEILVGPPRPAADPGPDPPDPGRAWERAVLASILARLERLEAAVAGPEGGRTVVSEWSNGATCCLSGGGLALEGADDLAPGTFLDLEIVLPDEARPPIRATGRVIGAPRPNPLGIAFAAIREEDREAIVRFTFRKQRARLRGLRDGRA